MLVCPSIVMCKYSLDFFGGAAYNCVSKAMKRRVGCGIPKRQVRLVKEPGQMQLKTTSERPQYGPVIPLSS
jgi:hypothetical protein